MSEHGPVPAFAATTLSESLKYLGTTRLQDANVKSDSSKSVVIVLMKSLIPNLIQPAQTFCDLIQLCVNLPARIKEPRRKCSRDSDNSDDDRKPVRIHCVIFVEAVARP